MTRHFISSSGIVLIAIFTTAGCGTGDRSAEPGQWTGTREEVDGVEVVRNPGSPLLGEDAVMIDSVWAAPSPADEETNGVWEAPFAVRAAGESIFVLDRMAHRIHRVDAVRGRWHGSIGREGGGPGEFEDPYGLAIEDDGLVVGNGGAAALERFGFDGEHRGSVRLSELGFRLHPLGDGYLVDSFVGREGGWKRVSADGQIAPFRWPESGASTLPESPGNCERVGTAGTTVFRLSCRQLAYQVISADGELQQEVVVERPPRAPSDAEIEAHLDEVRTTMQRSGLPRRTIETQVEREREKLRRNPSMRALRVNREPGSVAVWEQKPEELGSGPARLHVFSPGGVYVVEIPFERPWVDFDWNGRMLYALARDPQTGLVRLVAYTVELPAYGGE